MGNLALLNALAELAIEQPIQRFKQVILAAPDFDPRRFEQIIPALSKVVSGITLYASEWDHALNVSQRFSRYSRLGDAGENIFVRQGVDTIDASAVDTSLLGHSYYGSNRTVLTDMAMLLTGMTVNLRPGIRPVRRQEKEFWSFSP